MMKKRLAAALLAAVMAFGTSVSAFAADTTDAAKAGTVEKVDDTWYYHSQNGGKYTFEKVSHPDKGAGEVDGLLDEADSRSQTYSWSAIECGDYIYIGTCYNSTYGIYWRNVYNMMLNAGKTSAEAMQIARDFVQFVFNDQFDETLRPRGIIVKLNKTTGEFSAVYDSKNSQDPAIAATNCSGYRMAFEFKGKLYFVSLATPTMFLLEIDPQEDGTEKCEVAFQRSLSAEGRAKRIASGVHGLIVYDDEILMCLADEDSTRSSFKEEHPEGGLIVASSDARNWRIIANENDLGPSGYHEYDGLMGGGIWDIIEYNGAVYVTVVTDLTDPATGIVNKQGFALYRGVKNEDGSFAWTQLSGKDKEGNIVNNLPNGFGCNYAMACNMWVYDGYLYMGTYNDPMLDLAEVPAHANFEPLYWDLYYSINLYRMDSEGNIELIAGRPTETFPEVKGNMGPGLGDNSNQYVWRMVNHDDKLWLATYDTSTLTSVFTQLTDSQLVSMTPEEYQNRLTQLKKLATSLGILQEKYEKVFDAIFGSEEMRKLFDGIQRLIDAGTGKHDPVPPYLEMVSCYNAFKDKITNAKVPKLLKPLYNELLKALDKTFFQPMDKLIDEIGDVVFYFGTNYYIKNSTKGFDLLVSEDGVNFEVVTNDGFCDPSNHGVRTLTSADDGTTLYVGTANPYYGAQVWKVGTGMPDPDPNPDEMPKAPTNNEVIDLLSKTPVAVKCDKEGAEHTADYALDKDTFEVGTPVKADDGAITVSVTVTANTYVDAFKKSFDTTEPEVLHRLTSSATQSFDLTWDAENEKWTAADNTKVTFEVTEKPADPETKFTATFEAGENGKFADNAVTKVEVAEGDSIKSVPAVIANDGYEFTGWKNGETVYTAADVAGLIPTDDMTFTAQYKQTGSSVEEKVTVEFSAGADGKFAEGQTTKYEITKGGKLTEVPKVTPNSKYSFAGWKVQNDTKTYTENQILDMTFDVNTVITAAYNYTGGGSSGGGSSSSYTVKFEPGEHGALLGSTSFSIRSGSTLTTIPAVDVDDGYAFAGWRSGSTTYTNDQVKALKITKSITFTAQYKPSSGDAGSSSGKDWSNALEKDEHFAYISGYPDGTIKPTGNITREEVASIFYRLLKDTVREENETETNSFSDVSADRWSNKAVSTLASMGILSGYPDGTFKPTAPITRAEFAVVASKFDKLEDADASFSDISGHWALSYIGSASKKGWITGYSDSTFRPNAAILRAEAVSMTNRVLERKVDKSGLLDSAKQWSDNLASAWYYYDIMEASNSHHFNKLEGLEKWISLANDKIWN